MKKTFIASAFFLLGNLCVTRAQASVPSPPLPAGNAAADFSATSGAKATLLDPLLVSGSFSQPANLSDLRADSGFSTALVAEPAPADPAPPAPPPRFIYGGRDDYRWQLSLAAAWYRFRSNVFDASAVGVKTTVTYFLNDWFGLEGSFTGAFAPAILNSETVRMGLYGAGPKIAWRQKRWEPWAHGIFGGAHAHPQTAAGSQNSWSIMAGGGADYRWNPRLSFRLEGDYVRTGFYNQSQNNFQLAGGVVFHF